MSRWHGRARKVGSAARVVLALALAAATPAAAETLSDTLVQAYRTSPLLEQQRYLLRADDEDVAVAVSALRPAISFQSSLSSGVTRNRLVGRNVSNSASLQLVLDYTVLDGGQRALRLAAAKEAVLGARFGLVQFEQNVLLDAVLAYFDLRFAVAVVGVQESNVRLVGEQLRAAQDRFEVGEATRTDVAIAESRLAMGRSMLAAARGQVDIAREAYRMATGALPDSPLAAPPAPPALPPSLDRAQALALQIHPLITAGQHQVAALTLLADARAADRLPELGARLSAGQVRDRGSDLTASVTASVPIYTGGRLPALQRQAIAQAQAARADLGMTSREIVEGVGNAWAALAVARAQITATDEGVRAAQLAADGLREEAALGARTTLDVLDAEQDLLDARTDRLQAENDSQMAVYRMLAAIGLLTTEHLGLTVERYDPDAYYDAVSTAPQGVIVRPSERGNRLDRVMERFGRN